ncbi:TetR/AcrR family transcriptional regulator [Novosphingobium sp.]|uniref:TetR/AcrR family transcriptional regulator n=1 Tax=Novosphingobium sp. TaxID=1874826 RepID=UPI00273529B6|nr:TetR/AcrR family transcriptional regulator [Novosphingobium sp.]MDP3907566.1 helix-turn-helix domain-containing protein [Novosphingobium sp.]
MIQTDSPKDKRWVKTRGKLVRAGFELLGRHGIGAVGVDEIAAQAGIAKQTFYNHFIDRDAFLLDLRRESREIFEQIVTRINAEVESPTDRLAQGVAVHARMAILDPLHARFFANVAAMTFTEEQALNVGLITDLEAGRQRGEFAFGSIEAAVTLTGAVTQVTVAQLLELKHAQLAVPVTQEMLTMLLRGLGVQPDRAEQRASRMTNRIFFLEPAILAP